MPVTPRPERVFVIDDDALALKLTLRLLQHMGYHQVQCFTDARLALEAVSAGQVDIVLSDLQMPDMDGVQLLRGLAQLRFAGRIVLVSGEQGRVLQSVGRLAAAHGLFLAGTLQKPVSQAALQPALLRELHPAGRRSPPSHPVTLPELRAAFAQGELFNLYQPKVNLQTGQLVGVESLVRWAHPVHGVVAPDAFVTLAEEGGLIDDLLGRVLELAMQDSAAWARAGLKLSLAVNVSMDNLARRDLPDRVAALAAQHGVALPTLVMEVTESRLMRDPLQTMEALTRLRLKRVGLSIDDFGTGHSSLVQLRDLPFDELKVDKTFVHGAWQQPAMRSIVESNLQLAHQLGMTTVAEGLEDRQDWDFLRQTRCTLAQGYFIARPMPAGSLLAWTGEWAGRRAELLG